MMYLTPCPTCNEPIIFDGKAWDRDGFPYPHECVVELYVPTEKDFCKCGAYTQREACEDCPKRVEKKRVQMVGRPGGVDSQFEGEI